MHHFIWFLGQPRLYLAYITGSLFHETRGGGGGGGFDSKMKITFFYFFYNSENNFFAGTVWVTELFFLPN